MWSGSTSGDREVHGADQPQKGRPAHGNSQPLREAFTGLPAKGQRIVLQDVLKCHGPAPAAEGEPLDLLGEGLFGARGVVAEEPPDSKVNRGLLASDCAVGEPLPVPAVHSRRGGATPRAPSRQRAACGGDPHGPVDPDNTSDHHLRQVREEHFQQFRSLNPHTGRLPGTPRSAGDSVCRAPATPPHTVAAATAERETAGSPGIAGQGFAGTPTSIRCR